MLLSAPHLEPAIDGRRGLLKDFCLDFFLVVGIIMYAAACCLRAQSADATFLPFAFRSAVP